MATALERKLTTFAEYVRSSSEGIYGDSWTELVDGAVRAVSVRWWHNYVIRMLVRALEAAIGPGHMIADDATVRFNDTNAPRPNVVICREGLSAYISRDGCLTLDDIIYVSEVSDSTYADDAGDRLRRYAYAGILEYWIATIEDKSAPRLEVFTNPSHGAYSNRTIYVPGDVVQLSVIESKPMAVEDFLVIR